MPVPQNIAIAIMFVPMAILIAYMDVRYRRIPNKLVLITLVGGLTLNTMGAGDVKLFAAIGAIVGSSLVLKTFLIVAVVGGILAAGKMIYTRRVSTTMFGVLQFFYGLLPGQRVPRFEVPADQSYTLPYAVPICFGSLISFLLFHA